jgi:hypothetical protein
VRCAGVPNCTRPRLIMAGTPACDAQPMDPLGSSRGQQSVWPRTPTLAPTQADLLSDSEVDQVSFAHTYGGVVPRSLALIRRPHSTISRVSFARFSRDGSVSRTLCLDDWSIPCGPPPTVELITVGGEMLFEVPR